MHAEKNKEGQMRKFILTIMTLICTFALAMGTLAACDVSPSSPSVNLEITGKPDGNVITLTSEVNTLALGCNQTGVTWSSSDTSVATVSGGVVTLHSAGSTTITATKGDKTHRRKRLRSRASRKTARCRLQTERCNFRQLARTKARLNGFPRINRLQR